LQTWRLVAGRLICNNLQLFPRARPAPSHRAVPCFRRSSRCRSDSLMAQHRADMVKLPAAPQKAAGRLMSQVVKTLGRSFSLSEEVSRSEQQPRGPQVGDFVVDRVRASDLSPTASVRVSSSRSSNPCNRARGTVGHFQRASRRKFAWQAAKYAKPTATRAFIERGDAAEVYDLIAYDPDFDLNPIPAGFLATCPNGHPAHQQRQPEEWLAARSESRLKFYCIFCDASWELDSTIRDGLTNWIDRGFSK
jgi:hypothetical protein